MQEELHGKVHWAAGVGSENNNHQSGGGLGGPCGGKAENEVQKGVARRIPLSRRAERMKSFLGEASVKCTRTTRRTKSLPLGNTPSIGCKEEGLGSRNAVRNSSPDPTHAPALQEPKTVIKRKWGEQRDKGNAWRDTVLRKELGTKTIQR